MLGFISDAELPLADDAMDEFLLEEPQVGDILLQVP